MTSRTMTLMTLACVLILALATFGFALGSAAEPAVDEQTKARVLQAIETYVEEDIGLKGKFLVLDPRVDEPLALTFDYVHSGVYPHPQGYRACVDFQDASGTVYDVDVVVFIGSSPRFLPESNRKKRDRPRERPVYEADIELSGVQRGSSPPSRLSEEGGTGRQREPDPTSVTSTRQVAEVSDSS